MGEDTSAAEWLTGLVLAASELVPSDIKGLVKKASQTIAGKIYDIFGVEPDGRPLVATKTWRLYPVRLPDSQIGLMKISDSPDFNGKLHREVQILRDLQHLADEIDREATSHGADPFNYGAQFPKVVETFDAGDRLAMILGFHSSISTYKQFQPLSLLTKDERVDLQTVVWILGKSLRFLDFVHRQGKYRLGFIQASNVLLETEEHGVFFLDFSKAQEKPYEHECRFEVVAAARMVWIAAGGKLDSELSVPPHDPEIMNSEQHDEFVAFLRELMKGDIEALEAHARLYEMADIFWPRERKTDEYGTVLKRPFHNWVTHPRKTV